MAQASEHPKAAELAEALGKDGIVRVPDLINADQLAAMQRSFTARLRRPQWNDVEGYYRTEKYRLMVGDVLALDQAFVDVALDPLVRDTLNVYLGTSFVLAEAKGWESLPTKRDFHGWHGDAWYDQSLVGEIPREVKLAFYLSDVETGAFNYLRGSHQKERPRQFLNQEVDRYDRSDMMQLSGPAGTAFLFDTSGIHRQGVPILEPRRALFLAYHDPSIPLEGGDLDSYRYHPLLLNAAFLGDLSSEDQRILGFGDKTHFLPAFERNGRYPRFHGLIGLTHAGCIRLDTFARRVYGRLRRIVAAR